MKILILLLLISANLIGQRELTITEMNSDGDAVIEINGEDENAPDFKRMMLGFNESNDGWLRMRTDHDLSFWTDSTKRVTIKNDGRVGIGTSAPETKLFVKDGRIAAEASTKTTSRFPSIFEHSTGFDFYHNNRNAGGLQFKENTATDNAPNISLTNISGQGKIKIKTNNLDRIIVDGQGEVKVTNLASPEGRAMYVKSDGTLALEEDQHMLIPSNYFMAFGPSRTWNIFGKLYSEGQLPHLNLDGLILEPSFPFTKVLVKTLELYYIDNDENDDIIFDIYSPANASSDRIRITTSGNINGSRTKYVQLNEVIDQSINEKIMLVVGNAENNDRAIFGAKVIYQRLYD